MVRVLVRSSLWNFRGTVLRSRPSGLVLHIGTVHNLGWTGLVVVPMERLWCELNGWVRHLAAGTPACFCEGKVQA